MTIDITKPKTREIPITTIVHVLPSIHVNVYRIRSVNKRFNNDVESMLSSIS